ncbi:putative metal-binding motif-containing protein [Pyxidicoccus sp. MSG2]|uniref:putative metal-binding motif-containing protein n=1 Tax=Pyxidicoccus sp. MSG2 TaxID=2996790 RepID=UPI00226EFDD7|nr:putative metal-binding motif-containing protein [Pyxidicoccus sp. MSG2]MCY1014220.1 putative metal-binding motif-containing protein [Pyxidicoccus sp. MSG2]
MRLLGLGATLMLCACTVPSLEELLGDRSVKVEAAFNFKAGCIVVEVRDKDAPAKSERVSFDVLARAASERRVDTVIRRHDDWGLSLEVIATAHEQSCSGPEVARDTRTVALDAEGVKTVAVALSAVDADGDGFMPTSGGGTDCADNDATVSQHTFYRDADGDGYGGADDMVRGCTVPSTQYVLRGGDCNDASTEQAPGRSELCDGLDNDCAGGIDDGLTQFSFYKDGDGDGVGAGSVMMGCAIPANHVASGNDCNDTDIQIKPGLPETCDDKDNDCAGGVDNGLPVATYYRDADADGFGKASDSLQKCRMPATGYVTDSTDCDDTASAVNPNATEVCNDIDDNCRVGTDEGFNKSWYRDEDGDSYGRQDQLVTNCTRPTGYVAPTAIFDCNDGDSAVKPGALELCNEIDDNCDNSVDEPFTTGMTRKGAACSTGPSCTGIYVCNAAKDNTTCNAPASINYYPDADGDGDGANAAAASVFCSDQPAPPNASTVKTDCDDADKYNKGNGTEVCDQRNNNCDPGSLVDEGNVCAGAGWKELTDTVLGGRNWNTVAINKDSPTGYPVWIAGANGALARRASAGDPFTSFDGACGTTTWNSAWVNIDGSVFLAGSGGWVAWHDGTTCVQQQPLEGGSNATGIIGFREEMLTILVVVDEGGRMHGWFLGNVPTVLDDNLPLYRDVHGFDSSRLFIVGQEAVSPNKPIIETLTDGPGTSPMTAQGSNNSSLRSVWMVSPALAYAVGDASYITRWTGTTWLTVTPPAAAEFTSVCAPDRSSVYVTDAAGVIRRYTGNQWAPALYTPGSAAPLKDIALVSPTSIWAVGPNGRVLHFPELP